MPDELETGKNYYVQPHNLYFHLKRIGVEPENNIETILRPRQQSKTDKKLILIGSFKNTFGAYLKAKYENADTCFIEPVYDLNELNNLRYFSDLYFHGHAVGGTNPSLPEAMASQSLIVAHNNVFNKMALGHDAFYFSSSLDITVILDSNIQRNDYLTLIKNNEIKIQPFYWLQILQTYLKRA